MKRLALALALSATTLSAAPLITSIDPAQGFTFSTTHVTIRGTDFANSDITCGFGVQCPVSVQFGSGPSTVLTVTPTEIKLLVYPQAAGLVDVRVSVEGKGSATATGAFRFNPIAKGSPEDYVRYLLPVVQRNVPGANGSLWTAQVKFRNRWASVIPIVGPVCPPPAQSDLCTSPYLASANATEDLNVTVLGDGTDGAFLYVPQSLNDPKPAITLRVRDLSKNATSFGTEFHLPQSDEYQPLVDLIAIPTDPRYRATLRIYGSNQAPQTVRVRTYAEQGNALLDEQVVMLNGIVTFVPELFPLHPAYLQLDPLPAAIRASGDRIRVTVDRMGENVSPPPPPIWAFVTVTDNVTQLTSTITPNR